METKKITGQITDKKPYTGNSDRAPQGDFYVDKNKYACWNEDDFNNFNEGDLVEVEFTEKENDYDGKHYTNRSITKISMLEVDKDLEISTSPLEVEHIKIADESKQSVTQIYKIGNLEYEVTLRLLNGN